MPWWTCHGLITRMEILLPKKGAPPPPLPLREGTQGRRHLKAISFLFSMQQRDHCFVLSWALLRPKGRRRGFTLHGLIIITTYPRPFQKHTELHNWSVHGRIQAALGFCSQFAPMFTLSRNLVRLWDVLTKRKICIFCHLCNIRNS